MQAATGELNLTVITLIAIAAVIGFFWLMWPNIQNAINLSPKNARKNLKKLLNSCLVIEESENRSEENTYQLLPAFKVYFEDVE